MPMPVINGGRAQRNTRRPGSVTSLPERIGDEIDGVPQLEQRANAVVFAEGGAPGLEERLRRDHQDAHLVDSQL